MNQLQTKQKKQDSTKNPMQQTGYSQGFSKLVDHPYLEAQGIIGNHGILRRHSGDIIQARLKIGQPDDKYEQEADRVADQVIRMPEKKESLVNGHSSLVRKEAEPVQAKPLADRITHVIQANHASEQSPSVTPHIESRINALEGGGQPLSESTRSYFETRFGEDFSQVRVHTDSLAADTAKSINAKAFTTGKDIAFGSNQYTPGTSTGKKLLAHELTHVVQQSGNLANHGKNSHHMVRKKEMDTEGIKHKTKKGELIFSGDSIIINFKPKRRYPNVKIQMEVGWLDNGEDGLNFQMKLDDNYVTCVAPFLGKPPIHNFSKCREYEIIVPNPPKNGKYYSLQFSERNTVSLYVKYKIIFEATPKILEQKRPGKSGNKNRYSID